MFTKIKLKVALLVLVPSITLGGMFQAAQGAESETTVKAANVATIDRSDAQSKLALVQSSVETQGSVDTRVRVAPLASKAVKAKSHSTYQDIENFSFDIGGSMPGGGI